MKDIDLRLTNKLLPISPDQSQLQDIDLGAILATAGDTMTEGDQSELDMEEAFSKDMAEESLGLSKVMRKSDK